MTDTLVFSLPAVPRSAQPEAHWWRVADGVVVARGADGAWVGQAVDAGREGRSLIGLAPADSVRLAIAEASAAATTPRQAAAIARVAAVEQSLGDPETLHAVSVPVPGDDGALVTAVVANAAMLEWIDWARALGADPDHIVPAASLLPVGDEWVAAKVGAEHLVGRHDMVLPNEPAIAQAILGDAEVRELPPEAIEAEIAAIAEAPILDLRIGRFAKRRRLVIDRDRIRELVILASLIPIITLLWAIVAIVRLESASDRLDSETLRIAETAVGRPVTLATAEAEMVQRLGRSASPGLSAPLAALYQGLQGEAAVSSTQIGYRGDGTLSVTLAAPAVADINRLLVALQRDGYRVTAVPRQAPDGRAMVEVTIRSGP
ncbi:MAG TPA: type II secretion system protein GspL [Sphingomicrobium sp.]|nr:type II secretion system protein GspL [Sphingomicrobium sp.]